MANCVFNSNYCTASPSASSRGALCVHLTFVKNSIIQNNQSSSYVAGLTSWDSRIVDCSIINNSSVNGRPALSVTNSAVVNTTITGNTSQGGHFTVSAGDNSVFRNVTITGNIAPSGAIGGSYADTILIANSIIAGNGFVNDDGIKYLKVSSSGYNILRNNQRVLFQH